VRSTPASPRHADKFTGLGTVDRRQRLAIQILKVVEVHRPIALIHGASLQLPTLEPDEHLARNRQIEVEPRGYPRFSLSAES
jgi:hypothetical protein